MGDEAPESQQPTRLDDMRLGKPVGARPDWQVTLVTWAWFFLVPGAMRVNTWPSRLKGRALVGYLAFKVMQGAAIRYWVVPWFRRMGRQQERLREELREELRERLGREPTSDEMFDFLAEREGVEVQRSAR